MVSLLMEFFSDLERWAEMHVHFFCKRSQKYYALDVLFVLDKKEALQLGENLQNILDL